MSASASLAALCVGASVWSAPRVPAASAEGARAQASAVSGLPEAAAYIRRGALPARLRGALGALGDRLERPGNERLVLEGTLERGGQTFPARLAVEAPGRVRLELRGDRGGALVYDERRSGDRLSKMTADEQALVETLAFDTAERFFVSQARGAASRFLGPRFRLDDGSSEAYAGPFYDLYQLTDECAVGGTIRRQTKLFYLNSDTLLPERVRYEGDRGGAPVQVEVVLGDWREVQGQRVPFSVVRTEDGRAALTLTFTAAALGPRRDDGLFSAQPR